MKIKKLDDKRDVTDSGYIIQTGKVNGGRNKPVGTIWQPATDPSGYRRIVIDGKKKLLHRVFWTVFNGQIPEGMEIDHINGEKVDNRLSNLRLVTRLDNHRAYNKPQGGSSKYRGVGWSKAKKKWCARITHNHKDIHIGQYDCEHAAARARDEKAIELGWPKEGLNFAI